LQVKDDANMVFLLVPPAMVVADYQPDIPTADVELLGIQSPQDVVILNIVTLRENGTATVNLKGPIVLNRRTWTGKQVVPLNAADYSTRHPLQPSN
jgi:flagellar assembly factor FliW